MINRRDCRYGRVGMMSLVVLAVCGILFAPGMPMAAETPVGRIDRLVGTVYVQHSWDAKPAVASQDDDLFHRDTITTGERSKASLGFINGAVLDMGEQTELVVKELHYRPDDALSQSTFTMKLGRVRAFIGKFINPASRFEIQTTTAVTGVVGTEQLVINERTERAGKAVDSTRAICTVGSVEVRNVDPKIPDRVILGAFQQVWVFDGAPPEDIMDVTMEELEGLLQEIMISVQEEEQGAAIQIEKRTRERKGAGPPPEKTSEDKAEGVKEGPGALEGAVPPGAPSQPVIAPPEAPREVEQPGLPEVPFPIETEGLFDKDLGGELGDEFSAEEVGTGLIEELGEAIQQQYTDEEAKDLKVLPEPPNPPDMEVEQERFPSL
ncbi:MAG: FecR domain-containing protein [bacterium]